MTEFSFVTPNTYQSFGIHFYIMLCLYIIHEKNFKLMCFCDTILHNLPESTSIQILGSSDFIGHSSIICEYDTVLQMKIPEAFMLCRNNTSWCWWHWRDGGSRLPLTHQRGAFNEKIPCSGLSEADNSEGITFL